MFRIVWSDFVRFFANVGRCFPVICLGSWIVDHGQDGTLAQRFRGRNLIRSSLALSSPSCVDMSQPFHAETRQTLAPHFLVFMVLLRIESGEQQTSIK